MSGFEEIKQSKVGGVTSTNKVNGHNVGRVVDHIVDWLKDYSIKSKTKGYVIGVSGGIDSAVVSTLCVKTGLPLIVVEMPIYQNQTQVDRGREHIEFLKNNYSNVTSIEIDLTKTYTNLYESLWDENIDTDKFLFTMANTRSKLRMLTLYGVAGQRDMLVCGTGNRVEDFGVGFFTKGGDGNCDVSPIGDLMKSEVYELGKYLGVVDSILLAKPTDGLHGDDRTDEDQLGATYPELEWAMEYVEEYTVIDENGDEVFDDKEVFVLNEREKEVLTIFLSFNRKNKHKMIPIPVCGIPTDILND